MVTMGFLVLAFVLAACGGGGSATAPVANPQTPLSIVATPILPDLNGKNDVGTSVVTVISAEFTPVNFTNPTAASFSVATGTGSTFTCNGVPANTATLAAFTITPVSGTGKFTAAAYLSMNNLPGVSNCVYSIPVTVTGGGVVSSSVPITFSFTTQSDVLSYSEKTYALWTGAYPYAVTKTGVTPVVNKTKYTFGVRPLTRCIIMDPSFLSKTKGKILTECQASDGSGRHVLYIDPTKNELHEYTGTIPSGIIWLDVTPFNLVRNKIGWDSQTKVVDGWYYTLLTGDWELWFLSDSTGLSTVVKAGTFIVDGNIKYLATYSN